MLLTCANCRARIPDGVHPYSMRIELFPRIEESLIITTEDLEIDFDTKLKKIVAQLEAMSEDEVQAETERVYSRFHFVVCDACRDMLARSLKENALKHES